MFARLLFKEFWENAWKIAACCIIGVSISMLMLRLRILDDMSTVKLLAFGHAILLPVIFCTDIFSGEMSRQTIYLLFKLPVNRAYIFFAKFVFIILAATIICGVNAASIELITQAREELNWVLFESFIRVLIPIISIMAWFCMVGCICRNEAVSVVMLLCVYIGWFCVCGFAGMYNHRILITFSPASIYESYRYPSLYLINYFAGTLTPIIIASYRYSRIRRFL